MMVEAALSASPLGLTALSDPPGQLALGSAASGANATAAAGGRAARLAAAGPASAAAPGGSGAGGAGGAGPKIAFMFLTRGPMPLARIWERFFEARGGVNHPAWCCLS